VHAGAHLTLAADKPGSLLLLVLHLQPLVFQPVLLTFLLQLLHTLGSLWLHLRLHHVVLEEAFGELLLQQQIYVVWILLLLLLCPLELFLFLLLL